MPRPSSRLTVHVGAILVSSTWSNQIWPNNQSIRRALPAKCMSLIVSTMINSTIGYRAPTSISTQPTAKDSPLAMEIKFRDRLPKTCCTRMDPVLSLALILISFQATRETTNMSSRLIGTPEPTSPWEVNQPMRKNSTQRTLRKTITLISLTSWEQDQDGSVRRAMATSTATLIPNTWQRRSRLLKSLSKTLTFVASMVRLYAFRNDIQERLLEARLNSMPSKETALEQKPRLVLRYSWQFLRKHRLQVSEPWVPCHIDFPSHLRLMTLYYTHTYHYGI